VTRFRASGRSSSTTGLRLRAAVGLPRFLLGFRATFCQAVVSADLSVALSASDRRMFVLPSVLICRRPERRSAALINSSCCSRFSLTMPHAWPGKPMVAKILSPTQKFRCLSTPQHQGGTRRGVETRLASWQLRRFGMAILRILSSSTLLNQLDGSALARFRVRRSTLQCPPFVDLAESLYLAVAIGSLKAIGNNGHGYSY
jgi:hypothetical protein